MLKLTSEQSADAQAILADIESALRHFLKRAGRLKLPGLSYGVEVAAREAGQFLDSIKEIRKTIFGEPGNGAWGARP